MKEVSYSKDILDLIKKLTKLTKQFRITKEESTISIRVACEKSMYVDFSSPVSNFDFEGHEIGFVENSFSKFHEFWSCFKKPILKQDQNKMIIQDGKSSIKYLLSDPDIIKNSFKGLKQLPNPVTSFKLSKDDFTHIRSMIQMIKSDNVIFKVNKTEIIVSVVNDITGNCYDHTISIEKEPTEIMEIPLKTTIFEAAPELEYEIIIYSGAFNFKSVNDNFTLSLFTGMKTSK